MSEVKPALLSDVQVEAEYGIPRPTLQTWRCRCITGPKFIRISRGLVRYRRSDVEKWLDDRTVTPMKTASEN